MAAITIADLNTAKLDVDHIAEIATSSALTATDRLGNVKRTLAGALAEFPDATAKAAQAATSASASATSASAAATSATSAASSASESTTSAAAAAGSATTAIAAQAQAEAARDAAYVNADVYASTAAGIAATTVGDQFQVPSADGLSYQRYLHEAGPVATPVGPPLPTAATSDNGLRKTPAIAITSAETVRDTGLAARTVLSARDSDDVVHQVLWMNEAGELDFIPSDELKGRLVAPPVFDLADARGSYAVSNIRKTTDHTVATVQDMGGQVYDAKQRVLGAFDTIVIDRVGPIELLPVVGQSNAGLSGTATTKLQAKQWPHSVLSFDGRFQMQGNNGLVDGAILTDLVPLYDPSSANNQYPMTMAGFAWATQQCRAGIAQQGTLAYSAWQGSQPASAFLSGTNNWTNLMTFTQRAVVCAGLYGRTTVCRDIVYIQGENSANWNTDFTTWVTTVIPAIKAITGQTDDITVALWQIVGVAPDNGVGGLQLAIADSRSDVDLVGCMYPFPVVDSQHLSPEGRMMQGDVFGDYKLQRARGSAWTPLKMSSAVRVGAVVTVTCALPPGTTSVVKKTDWPPQVTQDGFVYRDSAGDTAISSISYSGNTITLNLAATPSGTSPVVRYGLDNGSGVAGTYQLGGNACAISRTRSAFYDQGFDVPEYVRHALARQSIAVS